MAQTAVLSSSVTTNFGYVNFSTLDGSSSANGPKFRIRLSFNDATTITDAIKNAGLKSNQRSPIQPGRCVYGNKGMFYADFTSFGPVPIVDQNGNAMPASSIVPGCIARVEFTPTSSKGWINLTLTGVQVDTTQATAKFNNPTYTPINIANIPQELIQNGRWCCWSYDVDDPKYIEKLLTDPNAKAPKLPIDVLTGRGLSSSDPAAWVSFASAMAYHASGQYTGIGLLLEHGRYTGFDLDNCVNADGTLSPFALSIVNQLCSYAEISPSKKGIKILVKGAKRVGYGCAGSNIEVYDERRYFAITGDVLAGSTLTLAENPAAIEAICKTNLPFDEDEANRKQQCNERLAQLMAQCKSIDSLMPQQSRLNNARIMIGKIESSGDNDGSSVAIKAARIVVGYALDALDGCRLISEKLDAIGKSQSDGWIMRRYDETKTIRGEFVLIDQPKTIYRSPKSCEPDFDFVCDTIIEDNTVDGICTIVYYAQHFYRHIEGRYQKIEDEPIFFVELTKRKFVGICARHFSTLRAMLGNRLEIRQDEIGWISKPLSSFGKPTEIMPFRNGLLNLRKFCDGEPDPFMPATPGYFNEYCAPFDWDPVDPGCKLLEKTLDEVFPSQHRLPKSPETLLAQEWFG